MTTMTAADVIATLSNNDLRAAISARTSRIAAERADAIADRMRARLQDAAEKASRAAERALYLEARMFARSAFNIA